MNDHEGDRAVPLDPAASVAPPEPLAGGIVGIGPRPRTTPLPPTQVILPVRTGERSEPLFWYETRAMRLAALGVVAVAALATLGTVVARRPVASAALASEAPPADASTATPSADRAATPAAADSASTTAVISSAMASSGPTVETPARPARPATSASTARPTSGDRPSRATTTAPKAAPDVTPASAISTASVAAAASAPSSPPAARPVARAAETSVRLSPVVVTAVPAFDGRTIPIHAPPYTPPVASRPRPTPARGESVARRAPTRPARAAAGAARDAAAVAAETEAARGAVSEAVAEYAAAIGARDLPRMARVYTALSPGDRSTWSRFFQEVRTLDARLDVRDVRVLGAGVAEGRVTGEYEYQTRSSTNDTRKRVSFHGLFARDPSGTWRLVEIR